MSDIILLSLAELSQGLERRDFSAREVVQAFLDQSDKHSDLNCFITQDAELSLAQADKSDKRRAKGESHPLDGIPVAVKDSFCTKGVRTTAASRILESFIPPYESHVTSQLWKDGALLLGKTNMDEFSMGSASTHSIFGSVNNPWRSAKAPSSPLVAGGSSGGSAAAVAARLAPLALGGDTGGSIRQPAAFCGVVGVKPTYGRCSRFGLIAFASSLDQAGVLAGSVADAAIGLESIMGHDPRDSTCATDEVPELRKIKLSSVQGLRVGVPSEYMTEDVPASIRDVVNDCCQRLQEQGAIIKTLSLPHTKYALPVYYVIAPAEASSNLARYDGVRYGRRAPASDTQSLTDMYEITRTEGFCDEVKRRILIGTFVLSSGYYDAYYRKAQQVRTRIRDDFLSAFKGVDIIVTPTTPSTCFPHNEQPSTPVGMYHNDVFTVATSLAGLPGMNVPAGLDDDGLPIGVQLVAAPMQETMLFKAGLALESALDFLPWHLRKDQSNG